MFDFKGNLSKLAEELKKDKKDDVIDVVICIIKDVTGITLVRDQVFLKENRCKIKVFGPQKVKILLLKHKLEEVFLLNLNTKTLILEL